MNKKEYQAEYFQRKKQDKEWYENKKTKDALRYGKEYAREYMKKCNQRKKLKDGKNPQKEWVENNREKYNALVRKWRSKNKEKCYISQMKSLIRKFPEIAYDFVMSQNAESNSTSQKLPDLNKDVLNWLSEQQQKQMEINTTWLISQFDEIHSCLCKDQNGTWQQRVEQVVLKAKEMENITNNKLKAKIAEICDYYDVGEKGLKGSRIDMLQELRQLIEIS